MGLPLRREMHGSEKSLIKIDTHITCRELGKDYYVRVKLYTITDFTLHGGKFFVIQLLFHADNFTFSLFLLAQMRHQP
jgi:hypothetical protein